MGMSADNGTGISWRNSIVWPHKNTHTNIYNKNIYTYTHTRIHTRKDIQRKKNKQKKESTAHSWNQISFTAVKLIMFFNIQVDPNPGALGAWKSNSELRGTGKITYNL